MRSSHNISCLRQIKDSLTSVLLLHIILLALLPPIFCCLEETSNFSLSQDLYIHNICKDEMCLVLSEIWCQKLLQLESDQKKKTYTNHILTKLACRHSLDPMLVDFGLWSNSSQMLTFNF